MTIYDYSILPRTPLYMCSFQGIEICNPRLPLQNRWTMRSCAVLLFLLPILLSIVPIFTITDGFDPSIVKGQRVLICGASGGIGEQMVYKYAELGAHIGLVARRKKQLEVVAKEALARGAASVIVAPGDMSSEKSILNVVKQVLENTNWNGEMDVLVLNHAYQQWGWLVPDAKDIYATKIGALAKGGGGSNDFKFIDTQISVNFVSFVKLPLRLSHHCHVLVTRQVRTVISLPCPLVLAKLLCPSSPFMVAQSMRCMDFLIPFV